MMRLDVDAALREVRGKTMAEIDRATAATWAARAAAYKILAERADAAGGESCELWAGYDDARHEALEHAGTSDPSGRTVKEAARAIERAVADAARRRR